MTTNKRQVVILGAGYGGLRTALKLERLLKKKKTGGFCWLTNTTIINSKPGD